MIEDDNLADLEPGQFEGKLDKYLRAMSSFRDDIRKLAISGGSSKDILTLCDRFRDQDLVNLGVQLDDGQGAGMSSYAISLNVSLYMPHILLMLYTGFLSYSPIHDPHIPILSILSILPILYSYPVDSVLYVYPLASLPLFSVIVSS